MAMWALEHHVGDSRATGTEQVQRERGPNAFCWKLLPAARRNANASADCLGCIQGQRW